MLRTRRRSMEIPTPICSARFAAEFRERMYLAAMGKNRNGNEERGNLRSPSVSRVKVKTASASGDAVYGKEFLEGSANCSKCHMVAGKGGRLGPELTATGSSLSTRSIIESVRDRIPGRHRGHCGGRTDQGNSCELGSVQPPDDGYGRTNSFVCPRPTALRHPKPHLAEPPYKTVALNDKDLRDIIGHFGRG